MRMQGQALGFLRCGRPLVAARLESRELCPHFRGAFVHGRLMLRREHRAAGQRQRPPALRSAEAAAAGLGSSGGDHRQQEPVCRALRGARRTQRGAVSGQRSTQLRLAAELPEPGPGKRAHAAGYQS